MAETPIEYADLQRLLPQRYPILLVDRVTDVSTDGLTAVKAVSGTDACYRDVPEGEPRQAYAYPVPLLIESFGQSAALAWFLRAKELGSVDAEVLLPLFAGLRDFRVLGSAYPGDLIRHEVRLDQIVEGAAFASGEIRVGETLIATVQSLLAVVRPSAALATNG